MSQIIEFNRVFPLEGSGKRAPSVPGGLGESTQRDSTQLWLALVIINQIHRVIHVHLLVVGEDSAASHGSCRRV
jgi:hypothetical protein